MITRARATHTHAPTRLLTTPPYLQVETLLLAESPFSAKALEDALGSLFDDSSASFLALPHQYFDSTSPATIAKHVATLIGACGWGVRVGASWGSRTCVARARRGDRLLAQMLSRHHHPHPPPSSPPAAAKEIARSNNRPMDLQIQQESNDMAFFAARSLISTDLRTGRVMRRDPFTTGTSPAAKLERFIEAKYLSQGENTSASADLSSFSAFTASLGSKAETINVEAAASTSPSSHLPQNWRLQCYRSRGVLGDGSHLRLYFLQTPDFVTPNPPAGETRISQLGDRHFLSRTPPALLEVYQKVREGGGRERGGVQRALKPRHAQPSPHFPTTFHPSPSHPRRC